MENAKKFFEELAKTEAAKALFASIEKPETEDALVAAYVEVAKKLGVELTAEEIKEYYASSRMSDAQEIDDNELEQLVGGGEHAACGYSYITGENCIFADQCNKLWQDYHPITDKRAENHNQALYERLAREHYQFCMHLSVNEKYNEALDAIIK